ncbi:MAG: sugar ABC transporter ATP-binding protein [Fimbriimonadales bacterium]
MRQRLRASSITVTFGDVDVVAGVDLDLREGEIHALVGENGAGKSSLAKAISGVYRARKGTIELDGAEVSFRNPREALDAGVALIHQEPLSFPDLTVAENIFAGHPPKRAGLVDWRAMRTRAKELLDTLAVDLDPDANVGSLSVAQRQQVELACALSHDAKVWIFDETTAPLTPKEVEELFAVMRKLQQRGCALLMVTHHLHEVFAVADRITVMRDGTKVAAKATKETDEAEIVRLMVGRELAEEHFAAGIPGEPILTVKDLSGPGFAEVSLEVRKGEIVGLAGLVGAGRTELARALFGITTPSSGQVFFEGKPVAARSPEQAMRLGIGLVPEDRRNDGLLMPQSIAFNATLANLRKLCRSGWLNLRRIETETVDAVERLHLAYQSHGQAAGELSGGNQQKVVLSKWLMTQPKLLILDEPTRGVDVGAKHEVHAIVRELAAQGMGVLMISSDLPEVLALSDRVVVMRQGRVAAELAASEASQEAIMFAATGQAEASRV